MRYRITADSEIVGKDGETLRTLKAGEVVGDLTPAQIKGLKANDAIEASTSGKKA